MERSSKDYERQAETSRNRLADTLDELHDRLTPGHLLDEVLTYTRGGSATFLRALANAARENPLPALLIGAGCAMFLAEKTGVTRRIGSSGDGTSVPYGGNRSTGWFGRAAESTADYASSTGRSMRSTAAGAVDTARDQAGSLASGVRDRAAAVGSTVSQTADSLRNKAAGAASSVADRASATGERVSNVATSVGDTVSNTAASVGAAASGAVEGARRGLHEATSRVSETADQVRQRAVGLGETVQDYAASAADYATSAAERVSDTAERTRQQAADAARQAKETASSFVKEQPLLVAAIGLGIGALIAAALPKSRIEDQFLGEASDAVKETIGEVAAGQYEKAKAVAGSIAEQAMAKAREEGLSPGGMADAARDLGEKAKRVATEAASSASSALQQSAGEASKKS